MSQEAAQAFLDRLEQDEDFTNELEGLKDDPPAVIARVREEGFDVTNTEIRDAFLERYGTELSPEQLDQIAAGTDYVAIGVGAGVGGLVVGVVGAAAAAIF